MGQGMRRQQAWAWAAVALGMWVAMPSASASNPLVTDSRIKTLVYSENEVFPLVTYYGYQSNIEFGKNEKIRTISVGDQVAWQIIPAGRYLFIRAMHDSARTNMTVITNKHTYQFDLISRPRTRADGELSYVMRFYYPNGGEAANGAMPAMMPMAGAMPPVGMQPMGAPVVPPYYAPPASMTAPVAPVAANAIEPVMATAPAASAMPAGEPGMLLPPTQPVTPEPILPMQQAMPAQGQQPWQPASGTAPMAAHLPPGGMNYHYTLSGPETLAPLKVYDDGRQTYVVMANQTMWPSFFEVDATGAERPVQATRQGEAWVLPVVAAKLTVRQGQDVVCLYNEALTGAQQVSGLR